MEAFFHVDLLTFNTSAVLPLGEGIIVDPFMGSGSTVAAAESLGICCIGVERYQKYYEMSRTAIPSLAALEISITSSLKNENGSDNVLNVKPPTNQLTLW